MTFPILSAYIPFNVKYKYELLVEPLLFCATPPLRVDWLICSLSLHTSNISQLDKGLSLLDTLQTEWWLKIYIHIIHINHPHFQVQQ